MIRRISRLLSIRRAISAIRDDLEYRETQRSIILHWKLGEKELDYANKEVDDCKKAIKRLTKEYNEKKYIWMRKLKNEY